MKFTLFANLMPETHYVKCTGMTFLHLVWFPVSVMHTAFMKCTFLVNVTLTPSELITVSVTDTGFYVCVYVHVYICIHIRLQIYRYDINKKKFGIVFETQST